MHNAFGNWYRVSVDNISVIGNDIMSLPRS